MPEYKSNRREEEGVASVGSSWRRFTVLVLTRRPGTKVRIGIDVTLTVLEVRGKKVRIGIDASDRVSILREELCELPVMFSREMNRVLPKR
jgi:carbon storage regulator